MPTERWWRIRFAGQEVQHLSRDITAGDARTLCGLYFRRHRFTASPRALMGCSLCAACASLSSNPAREETGRAVPRLGAAASQEGV